MASFTIGEILRAVNGTLLHEGECRSVCGVSTDTRDIQAGMLFIPLTGENFDGHAFLGKAAAGGAPAVLTESAEKAEGLPDKVSVVLVENTLQALEDLAHFHRKRFDIPVVAITGSNGKTTTKDMTTAVLESIFQVCHTKKNFNNEIGLSKTLLELTENDQACVVEMGMRGLGQIEELCRIASPDVGVVTNVGLSHIGILGSQENIAKAKGELIRALPAEGTAVLNGDDPFVRAMGKTYNGQVIHFGLDRQGEVYADSVQLEAEETGFQCCLGNVKFPVRLKLLGIHNVYDALAAAAVGMRLGVPPEKIQDALCGFSSQGNSQKRYCIGGAEVLDDSYNANPRSVEMAFYALQQIPAQRHILVLGDMLELGASAERFHEEIGEKAASSHFDRLITVGALSRHTAYAAKKGGMTAVQCFDTVEEAAECLKKTAGKGDAVLIKGSHAMQLDKIAGLWNGGRK